ncbi:putative plant SNARE 11 [Heracleum sosnowskyi]|uniref:Plant SNARE 11 n=1 Tax=Heracleum sosnowskyi TaxID=360622 RepID=A0AAD8MJE7_9APIA|nr:putative plant SNARE 11 [Heracleum sosnowskyi]
MSSLSSISEELDELQGQITDIFRALSNGFQKLDKVKETSRQSRQLDDLTDRMRECKRLIKEFDIEVKEMESSNDAGTNRMLNERKQAMVKELNRFVGLKKQYASSLENKRADLFERPDESPAENNGLLASSMSNQELVDHGHKMMDETDQTIERSKQVLAETVEVGTETAATLKAQTEQMDRIVNELDSINFSIKKASKLVKEHGRQIATDRCIVFMLFLIVLGVIAIFIVKLVSPNNEDIQDVPGLAPPVPTNRRLLWNPNQEYYKKFV